MGCANSKQSRCKNCQSPYSPVPRSYSMHVHHPPQQKGESYHVVALTSTTLGSLKLDTSAADQNHNQHRHVNGYAAFHDDDDGEIIKPCVENVNGGCDKKSSDEFSMGVIEAKTWSNMINEKIPKIIPRTPIRTPPGEPETINTWELMEGLEDASPFRSVHHIRSFSFDIVRNPIQVSLDRPKSRLQENGNDLNLKLHENETVSQKPIWLQIADNDTNLNPIISDFDPDVISTFRKSMEELSPDNPFYLKPPVTTNNDDNVTALDATDTEKIDEVVITGYKCQPCGKEKLILYFTSLRGVRKTYEDCCHVRVILKGLGIRVDERDVSMHSVFKDELKELLGDGFPGGGLPRVFVGKKYIGGAEEIRRMHEEGQLENALERCEKVDDGSSGGGGGVCEACGDVRFVPCETCSGSCKIYYEGGRGGNDDEEVYSDEEKEDEETYHKEVVDDEKEEDSEFGFQRCPDCNENGLIRCPICCY